MSVASSVEHTRIYQDRFRVEISPRYVSLDDDMETSTVTPRKIVDADIPDLSSVMRQVLDLYRGPHDDHRGRLRPTDDVFLRTIELLVDAAITLNLDYERKPVPMGLVSPDFEGGVRIEWSREQAGLHLIIATGEEYVYHEVGDEYGTDDCVTAERLAFRLNKIDD
jgi:hypothetical protein